MDFLNLGGGDVSFSLFGVSLMSPGRPKSPVALGVMLDTSPCCYEAGAK